MQNNKFEIGVKKQSWLGEVHKGGEGPHWTVVSSRKKNNNNNNNRFLEKLWIPNTEHRWNGNWQQKTGVLAQARVPLPVYPTRIPRVQPRDWPEPSDNYFNAIWSSLSTKITNVHNISVKVRWSCPTLGVFLEYLVFGADLRLQMKTLSSPELPNCNCVQLVTDRHHVTPPFGPSTPTQQTGKPKIRTGCNAVCCPQPDVPSV
jgi:hypothetical protein